MRAPERFAAWLNTHRHHDEQMGLTYHYHPRSDSHSKALAEFIWEDLLVNCTTIRRDHEVGLIGYAVNFPYIWPGTNKAKAIDLAIGRLHGGKISEVLISCELKATMTEHGKSKPRIFDELSSSHQIVHAANPAAIAAGVTVVNVANTYISPTRQKVSGSVEVTQHRQPLVTAAMVAHLRGLQLRTRLDGTDEVGFDAYSTFVVDCDNDVEHAAKLYTNTPAPQPGDTDHYDQFLGRICVAYTSRFAEQLALTHL